MDRLAPSHRLHARWGANSTEGRFVCLKSKTDCKQSVSRRINAYIIRGVCTKSCQCQISILTYQVKFGSILGDFSDVILVLIPENILSKSIYNSKLYGDQNKQ